MLPGSAQQYEKWAGPIREVPAAYKVLTVGNKVETYLFYVAFPVLLIILGATGQWELLVRVVLTSAISFVLVSVVRKKIDAKRPYELLDIDPLIKKDTLGKSLPSRHVFSVYVISMCWLKFCLPVGVIGLLLGIDMAFIRVVGGVHFVRDVLWGAIIGIVCGLIGLWLI